MLVMSKRVTIHVDDDTYKRWKDAAQDGGHSLPTWFKRLAEGKTVVMPTPEDTKGVQEDAPFVSDVKQLATQEDAPIDSDVPEVVKPARKVNLLEHLTAPRTPKS